MAVLFRSRHCTHAAATPRPPLDHFSALLRVFWVRMAMRRASRFFLLRAASAGVSRAKGAASTVLAVLSSLIRISLKEAHYTGHTAAIPITGGPCAAAAECL